MARIAGVDIPRDKKVEIGLTYIFGIGRATALSILEVTGVNPAQRIRDLSDADIGASAPRSSAHTRSRAPSAPKSR
jgi:small subunit ribosomal protein S13